MFKFSNQFQYTYQRLGLNALHNCMASTHCWIASSLKVLSLCYVLVVIFIFGLVNCIWKQNIIWLIAFTSIIFLGPICHSMSWKCVISYLWCFACLIQLFFTCSILLSLRYHSCLESMSSKRNFSVGIKYVIHFQVFFFDNANCKYTGFGS